ncbi:hypothetical protein RB595_004675 [Gaeumannomyces hyphopodioides]
MTCCTLVLNLESPSDTVPVGAFLNRLESILSVSWTTKREAPETAYQQHFGLAGLVNQWKDCGSLGSSDAARLDFVKKCLNGGSPLGQSQEDDFFEDFNLWYDEAAKSCSVHPSDRGMQTYEISRKTKSSPSLDVWEAANSVLLALRKLGSCTSHSHCHNTPDLWPKLCVATHRKLPAAPDSCGVTVDSFDILIDVGEAKAQEAHIQTTRHPAPAPEAGGLPTIVVASFGAAKAAVKQRSMILDKICQESMLPRPLRRLDLELSWKDDEFKIKKLRGQDKTLNIDGQKSSISLDFLLRTADERSLTIQNRRILAVLLGYAVLNLHRTQWLQNSFTSSSVLLFPTSLSEASTGSKYHLSPFIATQLRSPGSTLAGYQDGQDDSRINMDLSGTTIDPDGAGAYPYDSDFDLDDSEIDPDDVVDHSMPILITFAAMLMEVYLGEPFELLAEKYSLGKGETSDHEFVKKLFDMLRDEKRIPDHERIVDSLEACLSLVEWVSDDAQELPDKTLRDLLYKKVVQPLEDDLCRANNKMNIDDIDTCKEFITFIPRQPAQLPQPAQRGQSCYPRGSLASPATPPGGHPRITTPPPRPADRSGFSLAIICALTREADAVELLFDEFYNGRYGKADSDEYQYTTGRIGVYSVVLVVLPRMGPVPSSQVVNSLRASFPNIKLALIVGICGGLPKIGKEDAFLGDVVISTSIFNHDFGRIYSGGMVPKTSIEDSLGRASNHIQGLVNFFSCQHMRHKLEASARENLARLQRNAQARYQCGDKYKRPPDAADRIFETGYEHRHRGGGALNSCACAACPESLCEEAKEKTCLELGCDTSQELLRTNRTAQRPPELVPKIFFGKVASGNSVMKSGQIRDEFANKNGVIAFEMEGAGAWEQLPCIIVKGICDYADSHKNKLWQDFAAATGAAVAAAMIDQYQLSDSAMKSAAATWL